MSLPLFSNMAICRPQSTGGGGSPVRHSTVDKSVMRLPLFRGWPITPGHVLFSKITVGTSSGGNHQTEVRYEYVLDGQRYVGSASLVAGLDEARALMRTYPAGNDVPVHYDPSRPERSLLVTQLNWHHAVLPAFALVFFLLAGMARAVGRARGRDAGMS